jgi:hypothetical protein
MVFEWIRASIAVEATVKCIYTFDDLIATVDKESWILYSIQTSFTCDLLETLLGRLSSCCGGVHRACIARVDRIPIYVTTAITSS